MSGLNPITCPPGSPEFNLNSDSSSSIAIRQNSILKNDEQQKLEGEPESQLENSEEVRALVRTLTRRSTFHPDVSNNPFSPQKDSVLDPNSSHFQPRVWTKAALHYHSRDPEAYPSRTAGIAFRDLSVHGYGKATDYQKSVGNVWLEALGMARSLVRSGGQRKIDILQKFDGLVENGEMLIVLGPPSSGCSTLLKTIAGETHGIYVDENSHLNYQGISANDMKFQFRGEAIYTAEIDVHFPMMTVGDTLSFAARARAPRHIPGGVDKLTYTTHMRDIVMAVFGISHTVNTKVGNDFIRGVSGGERKRVSIAEAVLSGSPLQCWDNSTRGLDSANAVEFCKNLRLATDLQGATACVAIYQAPQAAYDLFHKVVVLYEGRQIYFGRTRDAKKYFEDLGFVCPDRQTDGDFLTSMTSPEERVIRPGWENMAPRTSDEFATVWKNSDKRKALLEQIEAYNHKYPIGGEHLEKFKESRRAQQSKRQSMKSPYTLDYQQQIKLTLWRSFKRLVADPSLTLTQLFGNMLMAIVIGSVFLNLKATTENFFPRGALLFFSVLINAFGSVLEVLTLYAQRPIVEKHSRYALYHPSAEAWASMLMDLPYKILNTFTFNIPLYFMTNLRREAGAFFFFIFISFLITLAMSMTFRTIGAASRSLAQAMVPSAVVILGIMIYAGFALPKAYILGWSKWIFWINPLSYGFEALMVNEFHGRTFACWAYVPSGRLYDAVTGTQKVCSAVGSKPGLDFVLGADYLQMAYEYDIKNKWRNVGVLLAFIFFYCTTYVLATEFISEQKSKGEVLIFRRGISAGSQTAKTDEESGQSSPALVKKSVSNKKEFKGIEKQSAIFHWEDVCYDVKIKSETRRILDHVDGWVKPGTLTALMGVSGAGKTTLLDVLASRVTMGVISGGMFVNGQQRDESFQRKTGYVQQQDLHMATSTVREALEFSALLRQPAHIPREEKIRYIDEVISLLDMEGYAEAIVGVPGEGLNVEQRKRLTIGVELAAKPQLLLFLDEPTSGLDSQTSWSICDLMEKLTRNGQAILCTIHQPSAMLFQRFDRLLFLAKGGKTVYYGDIGQNAKVLTSYFERNGATPCPPAANPAEWMLDIIGAAPGCSTDIDWTKIWGESAEYAATKTELRRMKEELPRTDALLSNDAAYHREFAASFATQFWIVTQRVFTHYWRNPTYIYSKMALSLASALFIGFSFFKAKNSIQGLRNQMLSIFMIMSIFGQLVEQTMPAFVVQRALYESRERPAKAYSWKAFIMSSILVEIPWAIITSVLVYVAWYYPVGLYRNASPTHEEELRGALIFLLIVTYLIFTSTFSTLVIAVIGNAETGANIANLMFMMCLGFCGILITKDKIGDFWIFMYRVSPFTYLVSGMLSTAVANTNVTCAANEILTMQPPSGSTCAQYLNDYVAEAGGYIINGNATVGCHFCPMRTTNEFLRSVSAPYSEAWRNFGLMWVYIGFNIIGALVLYWIFRVPKKIHSEKEKKE